MFPAAELFIFGGTDRQSVEAVQPWTSNFPSGPPVSSSGEETPALPSRGPNEDQTSSRAAFLSAELHVARISQTASVP